MFACFGLYLLISDIYSMLGQMWDYMFVPQTAVYITYEKNQARYKISLKYNLFYFYQIIFSESYKLVDTCRKWN